jgi:hypothetical protein
MAKRYLCWKDPEYHAKLSPASQTTLLYQGGPLSDSAAEIFQQDPDFAIILMLRLCDEDAKVSGAIVPPLESYTDIMLSVCAPITAKTENYQLSRAQIDFYRANSYIKLTNLLPFYGISPSELSQWINDISLWEPGKTNEV